MIDSAAFLLHHHLSNLSSTTIAASSPNAAGSKDWGQFYSHDLRPFLSPPPHTTPGSALLFFLGRVQGLLSQVVQLVREHGFPILVTPGPDFPPEFGVKGQGRDQGYGDISPLPMPPHARQIVGLALPFTHLQGRLTCNPTMGLALLHSPCKL